MAEPEIDEEKLGGMERAVNRSDTRFREILVELKDSAEA